jgi:peptidoglycan hydrolase-like protein with peptidoglycan-binding domain
MALLGHGQPRPRCGGVVTMTTPVRRAAALLAPGALMVGLLVGSPVEGAPAPHPIGAAKPPCQRTLASYPILRPGDRKPAVRTLQCSLNDLGLGPVVVDGFYGPETKAAVKEIVDGFEGRPPHPYRINNGFWVLLFGRQLPDSNLASGAHGPVVKVLQRALRAAGATVVVDGSFGPQTETAVESYQKSNHVKETGVVDEQTRFFLGMGGVIGHLS